MLIAEIFRAFGYERSRRHVQERTDMEILFREHGITLD